MTKLDGTPFGSHGLITAPVVVFDGGMQRHSSEGKVNYSLVYDGPMFGRWAEHLSKGASLHGSRNWLKASGEDALERALESADRHHYQWRRGDTDEDHAAALFFNVNLYEYTKGRLA